MEKSASNKFVISWNILVKVSTLVFQTIFIEFISALLEGIETKWQSLARTLLVPSFKYAEFGHVL